MFKDEFKKIIKRVGKKMDYKVSVIVPVYNTEKYLDKCIQSLVEQSLESLEIILLDDGSSDSSGEICERYGQRYENVCVYHLKNGGPSKARNIGLRKAKGEYIGFVDSDDYVKKDIYKLLYEEAKQHKSDIVMCSYAIDNGNTSYELNMNYRAAYEGHEQIVSELCAAYSQIYHNGLYSVCNKIFEHDMLQKNKILFDEDLIRAEDAWFVFACLKKAKKVTFLNKTLYYYRQISTSTMHTIQEDRYERSKKFREKLKLENESLSISVDYNEFYYEFLYETFVYCRYMLKDNKPNIVRIVLDDPFFVKACQYSRFLPFHLKLMSHLERAQWKWILIKIIWIWANLIKSKE